MPSAQRIGPASRSTPSALKTSLGHRRALPTDLLRDASHRLGVISLMAAALWVVGTILYHIALRAMGNAGWMSPLPSDAFVIPGVIVSFALYAYTRSSGRDPRFVLDLGLGYMVFTALLLGMTIHWDHVAADWKIRPEIGWTGAIILIFAAIIPSTPLKTLIAGLIAVSMNPISMLIARWRGTWDFGPASNALLMHYPDYLLVGVSVVISHVLTNLGEQVAKAREMGSYELGELLGRGGMGEVYKATHRLLARPAAIKLIRPEMVAAGGGVGPQLAIKRFRREAEVAASLRSSHTVELYDFGVTDDQTLYFVMELLQGMTLEALVRLSGPLPSARVIHILLQVCDSLDEAHASGLVHRDIKPANIHLGQVGRRHDFVKVLDFGLVKAVAGTGDDQQSLATAGDLTPGTPAYMAPELLRGDAIDGRADIYAVGCVAYFLLTGQLVFEADGVVQMLARHLTAMPIPPSQRTELPIPVALEQQVLACLAKDPADRPQSAGALAQSLTAIAIEPWDEMQALKWWQLHGLT